MAEQALTHGKYRHRCWCKGHKGRVSIVYYSRPSLIMIIASSSQFHNYLPWGQRKISIVNIVLNVKALAPIRGLLRDYEPSNGPSFQSLYEYHPQLLTTFPLFRPARDRPAAPVPERQVGRHRGLLLPRQRHPRTQLHMEEEWEETALH